MTFDVLTIIILITLVFSISAFNNRSRMDAMMYIPYDVKHNGNYKRIITHIFIHADWMHLLFNVIALHSIGSLFLNAGVGVYFGYGTGLISTYGTVAGQLHFLALYFLGALFATIIPFARNQDNPGYRSLGASGAVSAVIFAAILWNPQMPLSLIFFPIGIPAYIFGPLYLLYEFYADKRGGTGIAHDAHIGGAIFGILYVLIINIGKGKEFIDIIF